MDWGLISLLEDDRWRDSGEEGYEYVSGVHEGGRVTDLHIEAYEALLSC